jgi:hypothetical protein
MRSAALSMTNPEERPSSSGGSMSALDCSRQSRLSGSRISKHNPTSAFGRIRGNSAFGTDGSYISPGMPSETSPSETETGD